MAADPQVGIRDALRAANSPFASHRGSPAYSPAARFAERSPSAQGRDMLTQSMPMSRFALICCFLPFCVSAFAQQNRGTAKGAALFSQNCAACHGSDGGGGERAPNIATRHEIVMLSDAQLNEIVSKGIPSAGMPSFGYLGDEQVGALVRYLRTLQGVGSNGSTPLPGDPAAGEQLFFGKASCSRCHMAKGRGGFMGEDLTDYARGRSIEAIRAAIIDPSDSPNGAGHLVTIRTKAGASYQGLIRAEDNFNVVLQSEDGGFHSISRSDISRTETGRLLMPQDYGTTLPTKEIDDVISYLVKSAESAGPAPTNRENED